MEKKKKKREQRAIRKSGKKQEREEISGNFNCFSISDFTKFREKKVCSNKKMNDFDSMLLNNIFFQQQS